MNTQCHTHCSARCYAQFYILLGVLVTVLVCPSAADQQQYFLSEDDIARAMSQDGISNSEDFPPNKYNMTVKVALQFNSINLIPDENKLVLDMHFRQNWNDPRLVNIGDSPPDDASIRSRAPLSAVDHIWTPDTFFRNALTVDSWDVPHKHQFIGIRKDGDVWFSQRVTVSVHCPEMTLLDDGPNQPFTCPLLLESYSYTAGHLTYEWMAMAIQMDSFHAQMQDFRTSKCGDEYISGDEYSCLKLDLHFIHPLSPRHIFAAAMYSSAFLMVTFSWATFWLEADRLAQRIMMGLTLLIIMMIQLVGVVMYEKGYNRKHLLKWLTGCTMYIILSICETLVAHVLLAVIPATVKQLRSGDKAVEWISTRVSRIIDVVSAILFAVTFLLFTVIYFAVIGSS